ncbi:MAG: type II toxin-antitoxin system VapC family toxin [Gaiellales bacterium]
MQTSANPIAYLDASALVKLVILEAESAALRAYVDPRPLLASCTLARVELPRAVARHGAEALSTSRRILAQLDLVQLDDELLDLAGELAGNLRSLDAVHVAAAMEFGDGLEALVTYDSRMAAAAHDLGLPVIAPA